MVAEAAFVRSWEVGRYTATLSCPRPRPGQVQAAVIEWHPEIPQRLTAAEVEAYRAGRDAAMRDLARRMGGRAGVVEAGAMGSKR